MHRMTKRKGNSGPPRPRERRAALRAADRSLAIEGLKRNEFGEAVGRRWINNEVTADEAVAILVKHHSETPDH
jgi:hypothetical protein